MLDRIIMETCAQAWSPYFKKDIDILEKTQRRAIKLIPSLKHLPYEERLRKLNLMPLVQRRLRGDLIETFKFMKGINKVHFSRFSNLSQGNRTTGHDQKIFKPILSKGSLPRKKFRFSIRLVNYYGSVFRTSGKKYLLICLSKIIILPGQENYALICPGKITAH